MTAVSTATPAAATTAANAATTAATTAQTTLGSNYQTFLKLLMTQLQNQDPTSPMDTNQFTSQLVQYSSVEQQIATNTNLGQLIQLGQSSAVMQSAALVGHKVTATSSQLSLQNGQAQLQFNAATAGPVSVSIADSQGKVLGTQTIDATVGTNTFTWDGSTNLGTTAPDGAYTVQVTDASTAGNGAAIPFTITATATGVTQSGTTTNLNLGAVSIPFSAISSVAQ